MGCGTEIELGVFLPQNLSFGEFFSEMMTSSRNPFSGLQEVGNAVYFVENGERCLACSQVEALRAR